MKKHKHTHMQKGPYTEEQMAYDTDLKRLRHGKTEEVWMSKKRIGDVHVY